MTFEHRFLKIATIPALAALCLSAAACGRTDEPEMIPVRILSDVHIIGASKDGNVDAINAGGDATIYDHDTYQTLGSVGAGHAFEIICATTKPSAYQVPVIYQGGKRTGLVNLNHTLAEQQSNAAFAGIKSC